MIVIMGFTEVLVHLLNYLAPAAGVGLVLALGARLVLRKKSHSLRKQWIVNALAGVIALTAGLMFFGHDAKMASYALLVLVCAASQTWMSASV